MLSDEQAIRDLISAWLKATAAGDLNGVLSLMTEDAVFLTPGREPMRGRNAFAASFEMLRHMRIEPESEIQEIRVDGNLAYCWNHLNVTITPLAGGERKHRSGYALSILKKVDGVWLLMRDANLMA